METIGELLKNQRVSRGLTLAEVHESTKIATQTLASLEENRFDAFPNRVYARAFLRDYANFLKLDSSDLLRRYEEEWGVEPVSLPRRSSWRLVTALAVVVVLLAALGGTAYYYSSRGEEVKVAPEQAPAAAKKPERIPVEKPAPAAPEQPKTRPPVAAKPAETPAKKPAEQLDKVRVTMRAAGRPVWVRVKTDGEKAIEKTLAPGDEASFVGDKNVFVRAGDAGGLEVTINGKNIGRFGPPGKPTERTFTLDPPAR